MPGSVGELSRASSGLPEPIEPQSAEDAQQASGRATTQPTEATAPPSQTERLPAMIDESTPPQVETLKARDAERREGFLRRLMRAWRGGEIGGASAMATPSAPATEEAAPKGIQLKRRDAFLAAAGLGLLPPSSVVTNQPAVAASSLLLDAARAFRQLNNGLFITNMLEDAGNELNPADFPGLIMRLKTLQENSPNNYDLKVYEELIMPRTEPHTGHLESVVESIGKLNNEVDFVVRHEGYMELDKDTQAILRIFRSRINRDPAKLAEFLSSLKPLSPEARLETVMRRVLTPTQLIEFERQTLQPKSLPVDQINAEIIKANTRISEPLKALLMEGRTRLSQADLSRLIAHVESLPEDISRDVLKRWVNKSISNPFIEFERVTAEYQEQAALPRPQSERAVSHEGLERPATAETDVVRNRLDTVQKSLVVVTEQMAQARQLFVAAHRQDNGREASFTAADLAAIESNLRRQQEALTGEVAALESKLSQISQRTRDAVTLATRQAEPAARLQVEAGSAAAQPSTLTEGAAPSDSAGRRRLAGGSSSAHGVGGAGRRNFLPAVGALLAAVIAEAQKQLPGGRTNQ